MDKNQSSMQTKVNNHPQELHEPHVGGAHRARRVAYKRRHRVAFAQHKEAGK